MKKIQRAVYGAVVLSLTLGGRSVLAVEESVEAVRALPSQLLDYQIDGKALDGSGIIIADLDTQIDPDHPALAGKITSQADYSGEGLLDPDTTFYPYRSTNGERVWLNDLHATAVVGVMVSNGLDSDGTQTGHVGISPGASVAVGKFWESNLEKEVGGAFEAAYDLTTETASILLIEDQGINSYARGDSTYTIAVDYLAEARDVLVVIPAGNSGPNNISFAIPADAYNGLSVGATDPTTNRVASFSNKGPTDDIGTGRCKPDLVAPGVAMVVPFGGWEDDDGRDSSSAISYKHASLPADVTQFMSPNISTEEDVDPDWATVSGTSFSAPLVAGAGALLQQWGTYRGLDTSSQTMRAVMVNSVNKVDGLLGMSLTIEDREGLNWLASEAYSDQTIPLDDQMGAGQLDVSRALKQYDAGMQGPGVVENIGWDSNLILTEGDYYDYEFEDLLPAGDFISATLVWDRSVHYFDLGVVGEYESETDKFLGLPLDNLDLYLMHSDDTLTEQAVWSSISEVDNLEHIFWQIEQTGAYKLRVVFTEDTTFYPGYETLPDFTLAWWAGVPEPASGAMLLLVGLGLGRRVGRSY